MKQEYDSSYGYWCTDAYTYDSYGNVLTHTVTTASGTVTYQGSWQLFYNA